MTNIKHKVIYISCVMYEFCKKIYPNVRKKTEGIKSQIFLKNRKQKYNKRNNIVGKTAKTKQSDPNGEGK